MGKTSAVFIIGILSLLVLVSACSRSSEPGNNNVPKNGAQQKVVVNGAADSSANGADITSDMNVSTPPDLAVLDDINVSDEIPQ